MSKKRPVPRVAEAKPATKDRTPIFALLLSAAAILFGIYRAIDLRWISDDAFITMRYVKNFLDGNGLVYNIAERVEGYTHFLWLLLLSAAGELGVDPVDASIWLGILSFVGIIALLAFISFRATTSKQWIPLAAILFAVNYDNIVWASGGLETSLYALLLLGSFTVWFYTSLAERTRLILSGLLLTLASLTRPDGALFVILGAVLLVVHSRNARGRAVRSMTFFLLPAVTIGLPYLLWKYAYYGDLLPLTYYAKSAGGSYFSQGLYYIWLYFRVYFVFGLLCIASIVLFLRNRKAEARDPRGSPKAVAIVASLAYLIIFVARTGGDFMFARFIIPVVPLLLLAIEQTLWARVTQEQRRIALACVLIGAVFLENGLRSNVLFHHNEEGHLVENWNLTGEGSTHGIADERWTYYYGHFRFGDTVRGTMDVYSALGKYLEPFFRGLHVTVAIPGAMNMIAYYANFENCINMYGLTDSFIAHMPVSGRARIGHEKEAPEEYLRKRHTNFELSAVLAQPPQQLSGDDIVFDIPSLGLYQLAQLVTYDSAAMNELARRFAGADNRTKLPIFEYMIRDYLSSTISSRSLADLEADYGGFRQFYFSRYPNTSLQQPFEDRIAALRQDSVNPHTP